MSSKIKYVEAIGRRRTATARVRLYDVEDKRKIVKLWDYKLSPGVILVDKKPASDTFPSLVENNILMLPFRMTKTLHKYAVTAQASGSGLKGQLDAIVHGISRALDKINSEEYRPLLKKQGLLTRDPRARERRKAGLAQSARAKKQSPKR